MSNHTFKFDLNQRLQWKSKGLTGTVLARAQSIIQTDSYVLAIPSIAEGCAPYPSRWIDEEDLEAIEQKEIDVIQVQENR